jgi:uncharacterized membrane protein
MEEITWQSLATLPGAVAAVTLVITIFKAVIGIYWTELVNRIAALVLSILVVVGVTAFSGATDWPSIVLSVFNGLIVAGALLGVNKLYNQKVVQDRNLGLTKENGTVSQAETKKILAKAKNK